MRNQYCIISCCDKTKQQVPIVTDYWEKTKVVSNKKQAKKNAALLRKVHGESHSYYVVKIERV